MGNTDIQHPPRPAFGFFRLSKSKQHVDLSPNTLRKLHRERGLPFFQQKGARGVFVRYADVEELLARDRITKEPLVAA
jgi:hypothetical protein